MDTVKSSFEESKNLVSVSLQNSAFLNDGEYFGKVSRNVATLENIIGEIAEENTGLDVYDIQHSVLLLKREIFKCLSQGKSVNILDLGTLYIEVNGVVKGEHPKSSDIKDLKLHFTPSKLANEAVENVEIDKVVLSDRSPKINTIKDIWTDLENSCLTPGKVCHIVGKNIKLGGDTHSLSLIRVNEDGKEDKTTEPLLIDEKQIFINTKSQIYFFIPDNLKNNEKYKIRITTSYISSNRSKKMPETIDSIPLTVVKKDL